MGGSANEHPHGTRAKTHFAEADRIMVRVRGVALARLVVFVGGVALVSAGLNQNSSWTGVWAVGSVIVFFALVWIHGRQLALERLCRARGDVHDRHRRRAENEWQSFEHQGSAHMPDGHAFARDLNLFGPHSLFQRLSTAHTVPGARALGRRLTRRLTGDVFAGLPEEQNQVRALAPLVTLRTDLEARLAHHGEGLWDPEAFLRAIEPLSAMGDRKRTMGWLVQGGLWLVAIVALVCLQLGPPEWRTGSAVLVCAAFVSQAWLSFRASRTVGQLFSVVGQHRGMAEAYFSVSNTLREHGDGLAGGASTGDRNGERALKGLSVWWSLAELGQQFPLNIVLPLSLGWDHVLVLVMGRWASVHGPRFSHFVDRVAELEVLNSLATFADVEPHHAYPTFTDRARFVARALGHPLLPGQGRVNNDVDLDGIWVITGSNMAGKSTLLRSVGQNLVLALAGGAVCADELQVGPLELRSSIQVQDDLASGASYFHAELTKLGTVIEPGGEGVTVLFLLDELLRGTNGHARSVGARAVIEHLGTAGAIGLVATHDMSLTTLDCTAGVENHHFTDRMDGDRMVFDYILRPGPVRRSNALRLLRDLGVPVADEQGEDASWDHKGI